MTAKAERIDIIEPLFEICERLGLEPNLVAKLVITPRNATATIYRTRKDGSKYLDPVTTDAATRTETFDIKT